MQIVSFCMYATQTAKISLCTDLDKNSIEVTILFPSKYKLRKIQ